MHDLLDPALALPMTCLVAMAVLATAKVSAGPGYCHHVCSSHPVGVLWDGRMHPSPAASSSGHRHSCRAGAKPWSWGAEQLREAPDALPLLLPHQVLLD